MNQSTFPNFEAETSDYDSWANTKKEIAEIDEMLKDLDKEDKRRGNDDEVARMGN